MPGSYLVDEEGTAITSSNPLPTTPIPGVGATDLGKAEDAAHASGHVGVMALVVRKDTAVALAGTDGDYIPLIVDASGRLHVAGAVQEQFATRKINRATLSAGVVSAVDLGAVYGTLMFKNFGSGAIYIRFDGTDPSAADAASIEIEEGGSYVDPVGGQTFKVLGTAAARWQVVGVK